MSVFDDVQSLVLGKEAAPTGGRHEHHLIRRMRGALSQSGGMPDRCALLYQVVSRADARQQSRTYVRVPENDLWPATDTEWSEAGFEVVRGDSDGWLLGAVPWRPEWLPGSEVVLPAAAALAEEKRRDTQPAPGDPFLSVIGYPQYRSTGQREATRSVLTAPEGSTLVINLPTSAGKSLCSLLPALLGSEAGGITIIVVPTVALALDQSEALAPRLGHETAYYAGGKHNTAILRRLEAGTQRVIFTSPESLMLGAFPRLLLKAAAEGQFRYLVIDECHIVDQWGDDFRPAFQELSGLRQSLLARCPPGRRFVTVLQSATIHELCLTTLKTLFGAPGPFEMLAAVQLRPEPSYWVSKCDGENQKIGRLLEALARLPRPLILYTTLPEPQPHRRGASAREWFNLLRSRGYRRLALLTGRSTADQRLDVVRKWRGGDVDVVVGTSAFGMGVNVDEVRSIIHACVPESVDRFYQEVGRGGRDGRASVSLTVYSTSDLDVARDMNAKRLITTEVGLPRWDAMFRHNEWVGDVECAVPVNAYPPEGLDFSRGGRVDWNIKTLTLMARAGLIEFAADPRLAIEDAAVSEHEADTEHRRVVRILDESHLERETWEQKVNPARERTKAFSSFNHSLMLELLRGERCSSLIFSNLYRMPRNGSEEPTGFHVTPSLACGGCAYCRGAGLQPHLSPLPRPRPVDWGNLKVPIGEQLRRFLDQNQTLVITYEQESADVLWVQKLVRLLAWLAGQGVRNVIAPKQILEEFGRDWGSLQRPVVFFSEEFEPLFVPRQPTVAVVARDGKPRVPVQESGPPLVLVAPSRLEDPRQPGRPYIDSFNGRRHSFFEFQQRVGM